MERVKANRAVKIRVVLPLFLATAGGADMLGGLLVDPFKQLLEHLFERVNGLGLNSDLFLLLLLSLGLLS